MGGKALKGIDCVRLDKAQYENLCTKVLQTIQSKPDICRASVVQAYGNKESFGDMDVLVEWDRPPSELSALIQEWFAPQEMVLNGSVCSFNIENFQVDFIAETSLHYDVSRVYYAYNDLGNLMGRIAYAMGLKYGHHGLAYSVYAQRTDEGFSHLSVGRQDGVCLGDVTLSKDPAAIFSFLGYDFAKWEKGFSSLEDIYQFVVSSPYFHPDLFDLEKRTYKARVRDAKRSTYTGFLEWIKALDVYPPLEAKDTYRERHWERALAQWPALASQVSELVGAHALTQQASERMNSSRVVALEGIHIPIEKVRAWIQGLSCAWPDEASFHSWVVSQPMGDFDRWLVDSQHLAPFTPLLRTDVQQWTGLSSPQANELLTRLASEYSDFHAFRRWLHSADASTRESRVVDCAQRYQHTLALGELARAQKKHNSVAAVVGIEGGMGP